MSEITCTWMGDTICDDHTLCYNGALLSYGNFYSYGFKAAVATNIFGSGNSSDVSLYAYGAFSAFSSLYSVINDVETICECILQIYTDGISCNKFTVYNYGRLARYAIIL